jgi:hypothetical protein
MGVLDFAYKNDQFLDRESRAIASDQYRTNKQQVLQDLSVSFLNDAGVDLESGFLKRLVLSFTLYKRYKEFLTHLEAECHTYFVNTFMKLCFEKIIMNIEDSVVEEFVEHSTLDNFLRFTKFETDEAKIRAALSYFSDMNVFEEARTDIINLITHVIPHINSNILAKHETSGVRFVDMVDKVGPTPPHGTLLKEYDVDFVSCTLDVIDIGDKKAKGFKPYIVPPRNETTLLPEEMDTLDMQRECEEMAWEDYLANCPTSICIEFGRNPKQMDAKNVLVRMGVIEASERIEEQITALREIQIKVQEMISKMNSDEDYGSVYAELAEIKYDGEFNLAKYIESKVKVFTSGLIFEQFDPVKHAPVPADGSKSVRFSEMDTIPDSNRGLGDELSSEGEDVLTQDLHRVK